MIFNEQGPNVSQLDEYMWTQQLTKNSRTWQWTMSSEIHSVKLQDPAYMYSNSGLVLAITEYFEIIWVMSSATLL
jgi:hypothetical protein